MADMREKLAKRDDEIAALIKKLQIDEPVAENDDYDDEDDDDDGVEEMSDKDSNGHDDSDIIIIDWSICHLECICCLINSSKVM